MRRILKFLISLLIGVVVFIVVVQRVGFKSIESAFAFLFGLKGLLMVFLTFLIVSISAFKWKLIFKHQGENLSSKALMPLWLVGFAMDYLTPFSAFGGELFRMYFTKQKLQSLSWRKTISSVAIDKLLDATVYLFFVIIGLVVFTFYGRFPSAYLRASALSLVGFFVFLLLFFYFKRWRRESVLELVFKVFGIKKEKICRFDNGQGQAVFEAERDVFRFFSLKHKAFWQVLFLTFLRYAVLLLRCWFLIFFLVGNVGFFKPLAVYGFANLAGLIPLPASLGSLEVSEGVAFGVLGLGFGAGTVFSMVWRGADLLFCLIGAVFLIKFSAKVAEMKILKFLTILSKKSNSK